MLDQHDRIAQIDQPVQHVQQLGQVIEMQARGGFVQQVQRAARVGAGEFRCQFYALRLATGQRRSGLAECQVVQSYVAQGLQDAADLGQVLEQVERLAARQFQYVADRVAVVGHRQGLGVVPLALARLALDPNIRQEMHLDAFLAVAFAVFAAPPRDVETEAARRVAAQFGFRQLSEQFADPFEYAGVGRRIGGGRIAQRLLVDADHFVDVLDAADLVVRPRNGRSAVQTPSQRGVQHFVDQRTLAAAADPGDDRERTQRNPHVDVLQVVVPSSQDLDPIHIRRELASAAGRKGLGEPLPILRRRVPLQPAVRRDGDRLLAAQVRPGNRPAAPGKSARAAVRHDLPTELAGTRPEIANVVAARNHLPIMLDDHQRIPQVAQLVQGAEQPAVVARMQADRRLVQYVQHAAQSAAQLAGQPDALRLAVGQRRCAAGKRQIVQAHIQQELNAADDLADQFACDFAFAGRQLPTFDQLVEFAQGQTAPFVHRPVSEPNGRCIVAQPTAAAGGTLHLADELLQPRA